MKVEIKCKGAAFLSLRELKSFQGELKKLSPKNKQKLKNQLLKNGFTAPFFVWKNEGAFYILDGHQREVVLKELEKEGVELPEKFPVAFIEAKDEREAKEILLAINSHYGQMSSASFLGFLQDAKLDKSILEDLEFLNIDLGVIKEEFEELLEPEYKTDPDSLPEQKTEKEIKTKVGDLWLLGDHRLLCGDSLDPGSYDILLQDKKAQLCFTSPPYSEQRKDEYQGIPAAEYPFFIVQIGKNIFEFLKDKGSFFLNIKEHIEKGARSLYVLHSIIALVESGWSYIDQFIWYKAGLPGYWPNRLKNDFEPIHFFSKKDGVDWIVRELNLEEGEIESGVYNFYEDIFHFSRGVNIDFFPLQAGNKSEGIRLYHGVRRNKSKSGNITIQGKTRSGIAKPGNVIKVQGTEPIKHPAMFPVKLPEFFIKLTTQEGDIVLDPFMGAGSSIIAAEINKRKAFGIELEPVYCDLTVDRWERFTGKKAKKF